MGRGLLVVLLLLASGEARAWNPHGHRVVAAIAYPQLRPEVKRQVAALLRLNPEYPRWVAGVPAAERERAAFLRASNWADDIRELPDYTDAPAPPRSGYGDKHKHKDWHYTNRPL